MGHVSLAKLNSMPLNSEKHTFTSIMFRASRSMLLQSEIERGSISLMPLHIRTCIPMWLFHFISSARSAISFRQSPARRNFSDVMDGVSARRSMAHTLPVSNPHIQIHEVSPLTCISHKGHVIAVRQHTALACTIDVEMRISQQNISGSSGLTAVPEICFSEQMTAFTYSTE